MGWRILLQLLDPHSSFIRDQEARGEFARIWSAEYGELRGGSTVG